MATRRRWRHSVTTRIAHGYLERPPADRIYWERFGHGPAPALFLHGGPGSGVSDFYRTLFDPALNSVVAFDQRGCGRSTPSAAEDLDSLSHNNTRTLIDDIEALRESVGFERWMVVGLSWGATLAIA